MKHSQPARFGASQYVESSQYSLKRSSETTGAVSTICDVCMSIYTNINNTLCNLLVPVNGSRERPPRWFVLLTAMADEVQQFIEPPSGELCQRKNPWRLLDSGACQRPVFFFLRGIARFSLETAWGEDGYVL